jgi:hypothetical protein
MEEATDGYTSYVLEKVQAARKACSDPVVMVEQRVDFSRWVKQGFGTADALVIADGTLHVIDLKYGTGIEVSAEDNPQLKCYALGALELFDDIYDIDSTSPCTSTSRDVQNVSEWQIPKTNCSPGPQVLKPAADLAWDGKGEFSCGDWCRFCKAKTICRARAEENLKLAQHEFKLPPELSDAEIEVILSKVDGLVSWASDIKEYALQQALSGKEWHGFKLVEGRSVRKYTDETVRRQGGRRRRVRPVREEAARHHRHAETPRKEPLRRNSCRLHREAAGQTHTRAGQRQAPGHEHSKKRFYGGKTIMSKTTMHNPMKVITGPNTRWSYANVWEPKSINGGTPKYSVSLIIPKSDTATLTKIKAAIEAAYKEGEAKLKGTESPCRPCRRSRRPCVTATRSVRTTRPTGTLTSSMRTPRPLRASWMLI